MAPESGETGRGHREIEHTADLGFEVWAPDLPELYAESVQALANLCYDRDRVEPRQRRQLEVRGDSPEERMVRWLQEVYLLVEGELWLTADAVDVRVEDGAVGGTLRGEPHDPDRHAIYTEIKAITYHEMEIREQDGTWTTTVIIDV